MAAKLEDSNAYVRRLAVETLGILSPETFASHAYAVTKRIVDSDLKVHQLAWRVLIELDPTTLAQGSPKFAQHALTFVAKLEDSDVAVRIRALRALKHLHMASLTTLVQHVAAAIVAAMIRGLPSSGDTCTVQHRLET